MTANVPVPKYLVFFATLRCNLECAYCYASPQEQSGALPLSKALSALRLALGHDSPLHVQITGGEPTLEPGFLAEIILIVRAVAPHATLGVQTNGTRLESSLIRLFKTHDVQVGISIDGPQPIHDSLRGRFSETYKGMERLSDHGVPFRTTTVVTKENVRHLADLAELVGEFPTARGMALDLLVFRGRARNRKDLLPDAETLHDGMRSFAKRILKINQKRSTPLVLREWEHLRRLEKSPHRPSHFCHASRGENLAVLPDGSLFVCSQTAGDPAFSCGTVDHPNTEGFAAFRKNDRPTGDCTPCPLFGRCPGDCPSRIHYNGSARARLACVLYRTLWSVMDGKDR